MPSKRFKEELEGLESGLRGLLEAIKNSETRTKYEKALKNKEIQKERIEWFKRGYNLRNREIKGQEKLDGRK